MPPPNELPGAEPPSPSAEPAPAPSEDPNAAPTSPAEVVAPATSAPSVPSAPPDAPPATAPPTPAPPPPPILPQPELSPAFRLPAPLPAEIGVVEERTLPPPETTLGLELDGGVGARLGSASDYGFDRGERAGLVFGPSLWLSPDRLYSIGVAYERVSLGSDAADPETGSLSVKRDLDAFWLSGRAYPWRTDSVGVFVALGLGASVQHVTADGTRPSSTFVRPEEPFRCSASDSPGFALAGGLGLDVDLDRSLAFITQLGAAGHRQTSETLDGCAPGSGSLTTVAGHIGFAYRFDLDESSASSRRAGSRARAVARATYTR